MSFVSSGFRTLFSLRYSWNSSFAIFVSLLLFSESFCFSNFSISCSVEEANRRAMNLLRFQMPPTLLLKMMHCARNLQIIHKSASRLVNNLIPRINCRLLANEKTDRYDCKRRHRYVYLCPVYIPTYSQRESGSNITDLLEYAGTPANQTKVIVIDTVISVCFLLWCVFSCRTLKKLFFKALSCTGLRQINKYLKPGTSVPRGGD